MSLTVAVVVCAHRLERFHLTIRCVQSALRGSRRPDELFVVVDNNERLFEDLGNALNDACIRVIRNPGDGAAAARSAAVDLTAAEVCLFIDDDAWAERDWLANMVRAFSQQTVAGAGGRVLPDWAPDARRLPAELLWIVGSTYLGHPEGAVPITRPIGANMAARTAVIREVGGFLATFGPRGGKKVSSNEELALYTLITQRHGPESVVYVPSSVVHHHVPAERTTWRYLFGRCWAEGTSKADIQVKFRGGVMAHDRQYAGTTLVPGVARYLRRGFVDRDRDELLSAAKCAAALGVTGGAYLARLSRVA